MQECVLRHFNCVWLFASVWTVACQAPLSMGFSRQECVCVFPQSCPTLCDPMDYSPPGSSVHVIFQARILECVAISSFSGSSWLRHQTCVSCISWIGSQILYHCSTWEAARWEYWSRLPCLPPEDLPDQGIIWTSGSWIAGRFFNTEPLGKAHFMNTNAKILNKILVG